MNTLPYTVITETLDSLIASEIDRLESSLETARDMITEDEEYKLQDFIDQLESIRGEINED